MTATIDRERLAALKAREDEDFVARHPRSRELFERAQAHMLDGVPMNWMTRWSSPFPPYVAEAHGARFTCVDGHEYIDFCLGDTGAMTGHSPDGLGRGHRRPGRPRHHDDAAHRGLPLGGRRALAPLRPAVLAARADGDRRQPLRRPARPSRHQAAEDPRLQLLLPRLGGRDDHHHQRRRAGAEAGQRRPAGRPDRHDQGDRVERPRGAGAGARARRRGLRPRRARPHQHRHHPAGRRLPRGAAPADARDRHAAHHRRDAHDLRRSRAAAPGRGASSRTW